MVDANNVIDIRNGFLKGTTFIQNAYYKQKELAGHFNEQLNLKNLEIVQLKSKIEFLVKKSLEQEESKINLSAGHSSDQLNLKNLEIVQLKNKIELLAKKVEQEDIQHFILTQPSNYDQIKNEKVIDS